MTLRETTEPGEPAWASLFTSDVDTSRAFYGALFGWMTSSLPDEAGDLFELDGTPVVGLVANTPDGGLPDSWTTFLLTDDADASASAILAHGGQVLFSDRLGDLGTMMVATDATGATIGAWQKGAHPGYTLRDAAGTPVWHELHSLDFATSVSFYNAAFGWAPNSIGDTDEFRMVILGDDADSTAGIYDASRDGEFDATQWVIYFAVDDTDATVQRAVELGATLEREAEDTPYGRLANLVDPGGVSFRVMQVPSSPAE